jgi:hypothetical protein
MIILWQIYGDTLKIFDFFLKNVWQFKNKVVPLQSDFLKG